jgi:hypothetical protein
MKAKITDNGIIRNWTNEAPRLYYRKSTNGGINWTSYTAVVYYYTNLDSFYFKIPGSVADTRVEYYFAAQDIALPIPKMSTLPANGSGVNPPGTTPPPTRFVYDVLMVGIAGNNSELPREFKLYNNYPNPFNPVTKIKFDLPKSNLTLSEAKGLNVLLKVYDVLGREVSRIIDGELQPGRYEIDFNATNLPSGVYFYKLVSDSFSDVKRMILIK